MRQHLVERLRERAIRRAGDAFAARIEGRHLDTIAPIIEASLCSFACAALGGKTPNANDNGRA